MHGYDPVADDPQERARRAAEYRALITGSVQQAAIELPLNVACEYWRKLNKTYVGYLEGGGHPGSRHRSPKWREANAAWFASLETFAATLRTHYPHPENPALILKEAMQLIHNTVGPLCSGWSGPAGTASIAHHPDDPCPVHQAKETM